MHGMPLAEAGQEFILFSWKLLVCDLFIALYVLAVSVYIILIGCNVTTPVVISALFTWVDRCLLISPISPSELTSPVPHTNRMVTGLLFGVVILSPLLTLVQTALSWRTIQALENQMVERHEEFVKYYLGALRTVKSKA
jgi:uncharacterized iron-regulated membrane protein